MRTLTLEEASNVEGGYSTRGGIGGDLILTAGGGLLGFLLSGGNPAGALVGAELGHAYAKIIID